MLYIFSCLHIYFKGFMISTWYGIWLGKYIDPKGDLVKYLEGLASAADDVPSYVKEHPFGQPAITPNHPQWQCYSRVLRHLQKQKIFVDETCWAGVLNNGRHPILYYIYCKLSLLYCPRFFKFRFELYIQYIYVPSICLA